MIGELRDSVAGHAAREPLRPVSAPFPATITVARQVSAQALVSFRGNRYSVPPELAHATVTVTRRLNAAEIAIVTVSGIVVARHRVAADGAGVTVHDHGHVVALEHAVLGAFDNRAPHRRKQRIPPGPAALAAAERLTNPNNQARNSDGVVVDLSVYARAANGRNTLK